MKTAGAVNRVAGLNGNGAGKVTTKTATESFTIPAIDKRVIEVGIVGMAPLITHAWDEKAKALMLRKQMGKSHEPKENRDPYMEYVNSMYWLTPKPKKPTDKDIKKAKFGVPAPALKAAMVDACRHIDGLPMTVAKGAFHVLGRHVEIIGPPPTMRSDMVRLESGVCMERFRGEFAQWKMKVRIQYIASTLSAEQIINLLNLAGFVSGLCEMRPSAPKSKNGQFGLFEVQQG